jgi:hypothetical protein
MAQINNICINQYKLKKTQTVLYRETSYIYANPQDLKDKKAIHDESDMLYVILDAI